MNVKKLNFSWGAFTPPPIHTRTFNSRVEGSKPGGWLFAFLAAGLFFILAALACKGDNGPQAARLSFTLTGGAAPTGGTTVADGTVVDVDTTQFLTISTTTEGATIHYTTDGSNPSSSEDRITAAASSLSLSFDFVGTGSKMIRAIAVKSGSADSAQTTATFTVTQGDVDVDDNGLIEIRTLDMLDNIRHNLAGTNYKRSADDTGSTEGIPSPATEHENCDDDDAATTVTLCGYELIGNLDFANGADYGSGVVNTEWRPDMTDPGDATNAGFPSIGTSTNRFTAIFEGNGNVIKNLYIRSAGNVGLFDTVGANGIIRNVGLSQASLYGSTGRDNIGGLVAYNRGTITASHADLSHVEGGGGADKIGGLVGRTETSSVILASHATGDPRGGDSNDFVGGLVGENNGRIIASYATGNPHGGDGGDRVGGLVGYNWSTITASYATGNPSGGSGTDQVGGLGGTNQGGAITASYATGNPSGGSGTDQVGGLLGVSLGSTITASYGFGTPVTETGETPRSFGTPPVSTATALTVMNSATDAADRWSTTYWDFGTTSQNPALKYNDYDGSGSMYPSCSDNNGGFSEHVPGTNIDLECGMTLVGGAANQGR